MTACLRTPDSRFGNLPDYDFTPHYADIDGMRMHYVDEGPRDGSTINKATTRARQEESGRNMRIPFGDISQLVSRSDVTTEDRGGA